MPQLKQAINALNGIKVLDELKGNGYFTLVVGSESFELTGEGIEVRLQANPGFAAAQGATAVVVLSTELTPELIRAGLARDINRFVQDRRKEMNLQRTDRIRVWIDTEDEEIRNAVLENRDYLMRETLAVSLEQGSPEDDTQSFSVELGERVISIFVRLAE
jgi:isoleucyl-tRNA synthetase